MKRLTKDLTNKVISTIKAWVNINRVKEMDMNWICREIGNLYDIPYKKVEKLVHNHK
jgi:hypothetical protein